MPARTGPTNKPANGAYRHGLYSAKAADERHRLRDLLAQVPDYSLPDPAAPRFGEASFFHDTIEFPRPAPWYGPTFPSL